MTGNFKKILAFIQSLWNSSSGISEDCSCFLGLWLFFYFFLYFYYIHGYFDYMYVYVWPVYSADRCQRRSLDYQLELQAVLSCHRTENQTQDLENHPVLFTAGCSLLKPKIHYFINDFSMVTFLDMLLLELNEKFTYRKTLLC